MPELDQRRSNRRWIVLAVAVVTVVFGSAANYGLAFLIPALRNEGIGLSGAVSLITAPIAGIVFALVAWGAAADRWGERLVLSVGPIIAAAGLAVAAVSADTFLRGLGLFVAGLGGASVFSASGRMVFGWFGPRERGLAIGVRHAGQPVGLALAAVTLPALAAVSTALAFAALAAISLVSAALVAILVRDAPRAGTEAFSRRSPYGVPYLWRLHAASCLLVVPQFAVSVFAFDYLVNVLHWSIGAAGVLTGGSMLMGAVSRLIAGYWSDRLSNRLGLMRILTLAIGIAMLVLAGLAAGQSGLAAAALFVAGATTISPNALAFTAVAERAGMSWAGRALGIQNTLQHVIGAAVPIALAVVIGWWGGGSFGYAAAFGATVAFPFAAAALIPVRDEPRPT